MEKKRRSNMRRAGILVLIATVIGPAPADAWGLVGHRAVALVASQRLSPAARQAVAALLDGRAMVDAAEWADAVRTTTHPHTANWHSVYVPITTSGYDEARDCPPQEWGDCVLKALPRLERQIADTALPHQDRREALMLFIHLIADMHQPIHVGENGDRGGSARTIVPIGGSRHLHAAWDEGIIRASRVDTRAMVAAANQWLHGQDESAIARGSYQDWAMESFRTSRDVVYPQIADDRIDDGERTRALAVIEERIARAGVRLAARVTQALGLQ